MRAAVFPLLTLLSLPTALWAHPGHGVSESSAIAHLLEPDHAVVIFAFLLALLFGVGLRSPPRDRSSIGAAKK